MKPCGVAVLSLSLFAGLAVQSAYADGYVQPGVIRGPVPVHTLDPQDITKDHAEDIVTILQIFHAYIFYHDTHDGDRLASLFSSDGIFEDLYNDTAKGTLDPTKGVGGLGCTMVGRKQIAQYIKVSGTPEPLAFPGHSHHMPTAEIVSIDRFGITATMTANFQVVSTNDTTGAVTSGLTADYIVDFRRDAYAGWQITRILPINDSAGVSSSCSMNGPIPPAP